jgi:hypothetical protein
MLRCGWSQIHVSVDQIVHDAKDPKSEFETSCTQVKGKWNLTLSQFSLVHADRSGVGAITKPGLGSKSFG